MKKILFGTRQQAQDWAVSNDLNFHQPVAVNLSGFEGGEGAPDTFSGETNALPATDAEGNVVAYLAYWE